VVSSTIAHGPQRLHEGEGAGVGARLHARPSSCSTTRTCAWTSGELSSERPQQAAWLDMALANAGLIASCTSSAGERAVTRDPVARPPSVSVSARSSMPLPGPLQRGHYEARELLSQAVAQAGR